MCVSLILHVSCIAAFELGVRFLIRITFSRVSFRLLYYEVEFKFGKRKGGVLGSLLFCVDSVVMLNGD